MKTSVNHQLQMNGTLSHLPLKIQVSQSGPCMTSKVWRMTNSISKKGTSLHNFPRRMTRAGVREDFRVKLDIFLGLMWSHCRKKKLMIAM